MGVIREPSARRVKDGAAAMTDRNGIDATRVGHLPLEGIRVVGLEQAVAGPMCTRHLGDLGAEVIKIERPSGGDFARHYDTAVEGQSANFVWLNHGKMSVAVDVKSEVGRQQLWSILDTADVFVHNLGPHAIDRLGFGYESVSERNPRIVWCSISGYGVDGPYSDRKGFDLLLQGEAGVMAITGTPEEPVKVGVSIADNAAGVYALSAVLAVLFERERTGVGGRIDISLFDCMAEWMSYPALLAKNGRPPVRGGARHASIVPYGPYRCGDDRMVNIAVQTPVHWELFCRILGRPDWRDDERYSTNEVRVINRTSLEPDLEATLASWTADQLIASLEDAGIPYGRVNELAEFVRHPQLVERDRWRRCETPGGPTQVMAHPLNIAGLARRVGAVPRLGEHTEAVLASVGSGPQVRAPSVKTGG